MLPLHLDVRGRRVLVVGAGPVGARRARALHEAGASVVVVAPEVRGELPDGVELSLRPFEDADVEGAWLVLACTGVVDAEVAAACERAGTWCGRADDASQSAVWFPAVARADDVVVSVTAGRDPRRAVAVRDAVAALLDELPLERRR